NRRLPMDARPPPRLARRAARPGLEGPVAREVADKIAPLELAIRDDAPRRINLLIPAIDLDHFFGGYIAKLNLARRLAERGARDRVLPLLPLRAVLDRAASRLLPPPRDRRLRRRRSRGRPCRGGVPERDHAHRAADGRRPVVEEDPQAALLRATRAPRGAQH